MKKKQLDKKNENFMIKKMNLINGTIPLNYYKQIISQDLILKQNYKNVMELPNINKINLNITSNLFTQDKKYIVPALVALEFITGQKIKSTTARKSIASFKIRENQVLGCKTTLRHQYMYNFLSKFIQIVAPRARDFSGITVKNLNRSNIKSKTCYFTVGLKNLMIFPELENHFELFETCRGLDITFGISTTKGNDALLLYSAFQLPVFTK